MTARVDAVGNLIGRLEAPRRRRTLLLGSHLDTVRDAGRYDGPLGVLAAIALRRAAARRRGAAVRARGARLRRRGGAALRHRLPRQPRASPGAFDAGLLDAPRRRRHRRCATRCARSAATRTAIAGAARGARATLLGYVELHIEQGPVLEARDAPVGVVSAIAGRTRAAAASSPARPATPGPCRWRCAATRWPPPRECVGAVEARRAGDRRAAWRRSGELYGRSRARQRDPGRVRRSARRAPPDDEPRAGGRRSRCARTRRRDRARRQGGVELGRCALEHTPAVAVRPALPRAAGGRRPRRAASTCPRSPAAPATTRVDARRR